MAKVKVKRDKFRALLESEGMSLMNLKEEIEDIFPENPVAWSTLSGIMNGSRMNEYTLFRICKTLGVTPNDVLDF